MHGVAFDLYAESVGLKRLQTDECPRGHTARESKVAKIMNLSVLAGVAVSAVACGSLESKSWILWYVVIGGGCFFGLARLGRWLSTYQQKQRQKWAESHGFRYIGTDRELG